MPTNETRLIRPAKAAVVHKIIDITPSAEVPAGGKFLATPGRKLALGAACGVVFGVAIAALAWPHGRPAAVAAAAPAPRRPVAAAPAAVPVHPAAIAPVVAIAPKPAPAPVTLNLLTAIEQGDIECVWHGNGKDSMMLSARNLTDKPVHAFLPAGQLLASSDSTVVTVDGHLLEFTPNAVFHQELRTVATSSANRVTDSEYHLTNGPNPDLNKLFAYVNAHPSLSQGAVQTAALILTENLPLSAFAKFSELTGGVALLPDTRDFKADTVDILTALTVIKDIGIDRPLAVTIDPQLRIEGMIDPATHGMAVKYYGIADEWGYWKHELLEGDPSTRHYALYGIARFYPNVALQMLPNWARQESVSPVFRLSAVQALAQTDKAEAIPILRGLETEFGVRSELGRAAHAAANYLDDEFSRSSRAAAINATRGSAVKTALASAVVVRH